MPARSTVRAGGIRLTVTAEGFERTDAAFKGVQARVRTRTRDIIRAAAEETVLPKEKSAVSRYRIGGEPVRVVIAKSVRRDGAVITTRMRGGRGRAVGLLEFGGTVRATIRPRGKKALAFGGGHPVANVKTARHYHARLFMSGARDAALPAFGKDVRDRLVGEFAAEGFDVR